LKIITIENISKFIERIYPSYHLPRFHVTFLARNVVT